MKTITRADVAETIYEEIGLSRKDRTTFWIWFLMRLFRNFLPETMSNFLLSALLPCATKRHVPVAIRKPASKPKFHRAGLSRLNLLKRWEKLLTPRCGFERGKQMVVNKSKAAFRTIAEVAEELGVATHVLRFWETKFPQIKPMKRNGRPPLLSPGWCQTGQHY